jgi:hypothetical protein
MKFRLKLSALHLVSSVAVLTLVLGGLYLGWYRWPGWYLTGAMRVVPIVVLVDAALGPLLTLLVADARKPRRELTRDIGIIVAVQLLALGYGAATLWQGRPLYYTFSEDRLQLVQASDLSKQELELARSLNPKFAPSWYSRPRWVWAPLPADATARAQIIESATLGGDDVIQMPRYFKPWQSGLPALKAKLLTIDAQPDASLHRKKEHLRELMRQQGYAADEPVTMLLFGRSAPLLAVFDPNSLAIRGYLRSDFPLK